MSDTDLIEDARNDVETLVREGRMIEAIKLYREATGADLGQAKEAVEFIAAQMNRRDDVPPKPIAPSGCAVVLATIGIAVAASLAFAL